MRAARRGVVALALELRVVGHQPEPAPCPGKTSEALVVRKLDAADPAEAAVPVLENLVAFIQAFETIVGAGTDHAAGVAVDEILDVLLEKADRQVASGLEIVFQREIVVFRGLRLQVRIGGHHAHRLVVHRRRAQEVREIRPAETRRVAGAGEHVRRQIVLQVQTREHVAVPAVLFSNVTPLGGRPPPEFIIGDHADPGGAAGALFGRDLLANASAGEFGFLDADATGDIEPAQADVTHQVGGVHILRDLAVELQRIAGGGGDVFRELRRVGPPVADQRVGIERRHRLVAPAGGAIAVIVVGKLADVVVVDAGGGIAADHSVRAHVGIGRADLLAVAFLTTPAQSRLEVGRQRRRQRVLVVYVRPVDGVLVFKSLEVECRKPVVGAVGEGRPADLRHLGIQRIDALKAEADAQHLDCRNHAVLGAGRTGDVGPVIEEAPRESFFPAEDEIQRLRGSRAMILREADGRVDRLGHGVGKARPDLRHRRGHGDVTAVQTVVVI